MSRFVQGADRRQPTLLPECLDDYVAEDNPVRVVAVFVDELDLQGLGFEGMRPAATGRPAYHPAMLLKLYVYGYLNKVQSSRRLADFRRENGPAIQAACAQFVVLCRQLGLFGSALVAIDGSKFKAVNTRDKNFTAYKVKRRIEQVAEHIASYLEDLDTADRHEGEAVDARSDRLVEKVERLRAQMAMLKVMEAEVEASPDGQVSLTDPDARAMATSGRGSGMVGYNVQSAVEGEHHLIVAHEVVMTGSDKQQLASIAGQARDAMGVETLDVLADRGYFSGEEILACEALGVTTFVPRPLTSGAKANGRFGKQDFVYLPHQDVYRCPAGAILPRHMTTVEKGMTLHRYWDRASCTGCRLKPQCTPSVERRVTRWEHEAVIDTLQTRMDLRPRAMRERRSLVEHPFGTIKAWMGHTHFLMRRLPNVKAEISLHILAYNMKRVMAVLGAKPLMEAIRA